MTLKIIKLSLKTILNNKVRSILTMLGIIIGVMAVVILVSITQQASDGIASSISEMNPTKITATVNSSDVNITVDKIEELLEYDVIENVAPILTVNKNVKKGSTSGNYVVYGVTPNYITLQNVVIQKGRNITESDIKWNTNVCIIGTDVASELFGTWEAVNGTITIGDKIYKVIGVLEEQASSVTGVNNSTILIPYSTAVISTGEHNVSTFYLTASSEKTVDRAINITNTFLLQLIRDEDEFTVENESSVLDTLNEVDNTMSYLLAGIAAISLVVGGIGIMNIMLVSVSERTKEIGIRKAVGAKPKHIMYQFLCESCVLSILGGLIGLVLSFVGIQVYNLISSANATMNFGIGFLSILFCAIIGVLFGSYPAFKASKLQPIEALHNV